MKVGNFPKFFYWGGGKVIADSWSFGWKTGVDNDLICATPHINTVLAGERALSPVCSNKFLALCAFFAKAFLIRIDQNLRGLES